MESFDCSGAGGPARVVTLDAGERFGLSRPGVDEPWEVSTVTAFGGGPGTAVPYFTVAGRPFGERGPEAFSELEHEFTDAGVLPPHVRPAVEDLVPVVDTPELVRGFHQGRPVGDRVTRVGGYTDEHTYAQQPQTALAQAGRRAAFEESERQRWAARSSQPSVSMDPRVVRFPSSPVQVLPSRSGLGRA